MDNELENQKENKTISTIRVILKLMRIRNCTIAFFGVIVGALLVSSPQETEFIKVFTAALTAAIITGGGNTLNDYFDINVDKINKPKRPIPAGKIQKSDALMLAIGLLFIGLGLAKTINKYCLAIALVNAIMLVIYAAYSKRMLFISNLGVSYLVASIFIFGALATISPGETIDVQKIRIATVITGCAFLMTLAREIIKDIEDVEGDTKLYSKTLPIVIGPAKSRNVAALFAITGILLSLTPIIYKFTTLHLPVYGILIGITDLAFIAALTMSAPLAQRIMVFGMLSSLLAFFLGRMYA